MIVAVNVARSPSEASSADAGVTVAAAGRGGSGAAGDFGVAAGGGESGQDGSGQSKRWRWDTSWKRGMNAWEHRKQALGPQEVRLPPARRTERGAFVITSLV